MPGPKGEVSMVILNLLALIWFMRNTGKWVHLAISDVQE